MELKIKGKDAFFKKLRSVNKGATLRQMTDEAGVIAISFFKERFVYKNWLDKSRDPWKPRKRKDRGSLMARTGRLKRSIRKLYSGNYYVAIGTDVPYAQIHNEGGKIKETVRVRTHQRKRKGRTHTVRGHTRRMNVVVPARPFIGDSHFLAKKIERHLIRRITQKLKK